MSMPKSKEYRKELAEMFARILEEKELDWKKEWKGLANVPVNAVKERKYKGINAFALMLTMMERGYTDPRFATFKQIQDMGCKLHDAKGMGIRVEYWFPYDQVEKKALTWDEFKLATNGIPDDRYVLRTKYSTVFNAAHIEGLPERELKEIHDVTADELISKLSTNMGVEILNDGGDRAFYRPAEDKIHLPIPEAFESDYAYNSTALHELAHSTGAPHRLNRNIKNFFGSEEYAYEELIAEITSCFMSTDLNMKQDAIHLDNHKAYIQSWIKSIREKPETLAKAIAEAEKTAAYMEFKAELIPEYEYQKLIGSTIDVPSVEREQTLEHSKAEMYDVARALNNTSNNEKIRKFVDLDGTAAVFKPVDTLETLYEKGYFYNLEPIQNVVDAIKILMEKYPEIEIYIMSSVLSDSKYALQEKNAWIDKYLPGIDMEHRIFPPCGENKLDYIPGGVRETDWLLDDYTHNLTLWEPPARGIKLLNGINHTRETWRGNRLRFDKPAEELAENMAEIILDGVVIRDIKPQEDEITTILSDMENTLKDISGMNKELAKQNKNLGDTLQKKGYEVKTVDLNSKPAKSSSVDMNKLRTEKEFTPKM